MILFGDKIKPWEDPEFIEILKIVQSYTVVDYIRLFFLWQSAKQTISLEGEVAEIGVYRGGTAYLLLQTLNTSTYLFDTFEGMPSTNPQFDIHNEGDFNKTSVEDVIEYLSIYKDMIYICKGLFPKTATSVENIKFKFVHVDVDIYQSTKDCCEFFYPRMVKNGIIVFDDYGFNTCPGAKKAVDDYFKDKEETIIYIPTGQALMIKL